MSATLELLEAPAYPGPDLTPAHHGCARVRLAGLAVERPPRQLFTFGRPKQVSCRFRTCLHCRPSILALLQCSCVRAPASQGTKTLRRKQHHNPSLYQVSFRKSAKLGHDFPMPLSKTKRHIVVGSSVGRTLDILQTIRNTR